MIITVRDLHVAVMEIAVLMEFTMVDRLEVEVMYPMELTDQQDRRTITLLPMERLDQIDLRVQAIQADPPELLKVDHQQGRIMLLLDQVTVRHRQIMVVVAVAVEEVAVAAAEEVVVQHVEAVEVN
ncbi:hypothetical protein D3C87_357390 [compost metagenome]